MKALSLSYRSVGIVSFLMSMAAGGAQFLSFIALNHILEPEAFSRISTILMSYSIFFVVVELGIQGEVIRRMSQGDVRSVVSQAMGLRLILSFLAIISALVFSFFGGLAWESMLGMMLFSLSHIPASILLTLEELGYATRDGVFLILHRLSRLVAVGVFLGVILLVAWTREQLPFPFQSARAFGIFAFYPAVMFLFLLLGLARLKQKNLWLRPGWRGILELARSARHFAVATFFRWGGGYLFTLLVLALIGESNMSSYNIANIALTPLSIFTQVLVNVSASRMHQRASPAMTGFLFQVSLLLTLIVLGYTAVCSVPLVIHAIFKSLDYPAYLKMFIPLSLTQVLVSICSVMSIMFIEKKAPYMVALHAIVYCCVVVLLGPLLAPLGMTEYATIVPLLAALAAFIVYAIQYYRLVWKSERQNFKAAGLPASGSKEL
jgi:O-antigen/teichoic acid export membrane protein